MKKNVTKKKEVVSSIDILLNELTCGFIRNHLGIFCYFYQRGGIIEIKFLKLFQL